MGIGSWLKKTCKKAVSWVDERIVQPVARVVARVVEPVKKFVAPLKKLVAPIAAISWISAPFVWLSHHALWLHPHTAPFAAAAWLAAPFLRRVFGSKKKPQNPQAGDEGQNSSSPPSEIPITEIPSGDLCEVSTCS